VGFYLFPGLAKDVSVFGWDHLMGLAVMLCAAFLWYLVIAITARAVTLKSRGAAG
jgi:hypothetical protein